MTRFGEGSDGESNEPGNDASADSLPSVASGWWRRSPTVPIIAAAQPSGHQQVW